MHERPNHLHNGQAAAQADQGIPVNSIRPLDPDLEGAVIIGLKAKVGSDPTPRLSRFQCDRCWRILLLPAAWDIGQRVVGAFSFCGKTARSHRGAERDRA
jgi:hypothetical protein